MYSASSQRSTRHNKRTNLVLLSGRDPLARLSKLKLWVQQEYGSSGSIAVLASGEIFSMPNTTVHRQVFELDEFLKKIEVRVIRLAPGCACCSSKLIVQTHLSRLMRLNQPDVLLLELDTQSHVDQVTEWLESDQWKDWFSKVSVVQADH